MITRFRFVFGLVSVAALAAACSASNGNQFNTGGNSSGNTGGEGSGTGASDTGITITNGSGGSTGTGTVVCNHGPDEDGDADGWTGAEGDCNDCDPNVNPGAVDTETAVDGGMAMADNDCSGGFNPPQPCDQSVTIDSLDPYDGAKSVELCQKAQANPASKKDKKWGVLDAKWVLPDGSSITQVDQTYYHLGHGNLHALGPNVHVQAGGKMLGLSSGTARGPNDPGYQDVGGFDKLYTSGSPAGFPKESPACPNTLTGTPHDGAALELTIRTPTNATGFTFDFNFFTYEWPNYVCSQYNDFFVALLTPKPANQPDGNISFDKQGNPVSVNNAFVEVCGCPGFGPPCSAGGKTFTCSLGDMSLLGTGFGPDSDPVFGEDHASTSWLVTKAPVKGGENITIRWTVYDSGDGVLDTTTLIDNWQWIANGGSVSVGTDPIGTPK